MDKAILVWLGLMILFIVIEIATVGTDCHLACRRGSGCSARLSGRSGTGMADLRLYCCLDPAAGVYQTVCEEVHKRASRKTNYEELIGEVVKVTETVDNLEQTGTAVARGLEWTARSENNGEKLPAGSLAQVVAVSGVKLILKPYEEVEK